MFQILFGKTNKQCLDFENFMTSSFYDVTLCLLPLST